MSFKIIVLTIYFQLATSSLELNPVLNMLNVPWEGECPLSATLHRQPKLDNEWLGRCPTVYSVVTLPHHFQPNAILQGYCDPTCHDTTCSAFGNFRCRNYTSPVEVVTAEYGSTRLVQTVQVPVGCVCQFKKYTMLHSKHVQVEEFK